MAGAPGAGLQRGQDPDRAPRPRGSTSWDSTSVDTERQAADQTEQRRPSSGSGNGSPTEIRALRGSNAAAVMPQLNPIIRGWAAYYRTVVSSQGVPRAGPTTCGSSPTSGRATATPTSRNAGSSGRYFGKFNKFRNDRWVFGDRATRGAYLPKFAWTDIVRHTLVKGGASPDDPALTDYWAQRRRKVKPPLDPYTVRLLVQAGRTVHPVRGQPADPPTSHPSPQRAGNGGICG